MYKPSYSWHHIGHVAGPALLLGPMGPLGPGGAMAPAAPGRAWHDWDGAHMGMGQNPGT